MSNLAYLIPLIRNYLRNGGALLWVGMKIAFDYSEGLMKL